MINEQIQSRINHQKQVIRGLKKELSDKHNPTVKESIEKYIYNETIILNELYHEAHMKGGSRIVENNKKAGVPQLINKSHKFIIPRGN